MRIDGQTTAGSFVRYNKKSSDDASNDKVKSNDSRADRELEELKNKVPREYKLDDFIRSSKTKSTTILDKADVSASAIVQSSGISSQDIADKIKEVMAKEYPGYQASYAPEDNTSERISNNIIQGVTALLSTYAAQNKDLQGEDLINSFMKVVRGGVEKGLKDAKETLKALGALDGSNVESGIDETMKLVEVGLKDFETRYRKENGIPPLVDETKVDGQFAEKQEPTTISQQA